MSPYQQVHHYLSNHYEGMSPEQLILLLYNGALKRLELAREGIEEKNIPKKGENLSKAIAIISELNVSLDSKMKDESTEFLRGLYSAILTELPKVTLNDDLPTLERVEHYITGLRDIWQKNVMPEKKKNDCRASAFTTPDRDGSFRSISV